MAGSLVLSYIREECLDPLLLPSSSRSDGHHSVFNDLTGIFASTMGLLIYLLPHLPLYLLLPEPPLCTYKHIHNIFFFMASLKSLVYTQFLSVALSLGLHAVEICGYEIVMFLFIAWLHLWLQTAHKAMS